MIEVQKNKATLMDELVPSEFHLSQNYPNPFNDKTTIKYCLPEKVKVELTLFNSKHEKVKELISKVQNAGTYETILDGQDFPLGIYFYRLQAGSFVETKKMLLI